MARRGGSTGGSLLLPALCAAAAQLSSPSWAMRHAALLVEEEQLSAAAASSEASSATRQKEVDAFPTSDIHIAAMESRTRECVRSRAETFADSYTWLGLTAPIPGTKEKVEPLLLQLFGVEDRIARHEKHLKSYSKPVALAKRYRSSTRKALEKEKTALEEQLWLQGFLYDVATDRCDTRSMPFGAVAQSSSLTDDVYKCMQAMLRNATTQGPGARGGAGAGKGREEELQTALLRRLVAEDLIAHEQEKSSKMKSLKAPLVEIRDAGRRALKQVGFSFTESMKECKTLVGKTPSDTQFRERALKELDVGDTVDGVCQEEEGEMCPEGTAPDTQRRIDLQRGAKAATATYVVMKSTFTIGGGLLGLIAAGPAGMIAGMATGFFAVPATTFTAAAGFYFSIGPKTCACYLRECEFDAAAGVCALSEGTSAASSNPFGGALPYAGTKCGLKWKSSDECEVLQCTTEDYALAHTTAAAGGAELFGKFGTYEGDATLFNCLSGTGKPEAALSLLTTLPTSVNNTPQNRNIIFRSLGVPEKRDSHTEPTALPGDGGLEEEVEEEEEEEEE